jgi:hypothetical protein
MGGHVHWTDADLFDALKAYRVSNGLPWFTKTWDLNLFMVGDGTIGTWGDEAVLLTHDDANRRVIHRCVATRDAWEGEFKNPTHPDGCVWVMPGHYAGGLKAGHHKNRIAMVQVAPFKNVRWPPGMRHVPSVNELIKLGETESFMANRATNWHNRASHLAPMKPKTDDSEGCMVNLYYHQHVGAMRLVQNQLKARGSDVVSPTYLQINDL